MLSRFPSILEHRQFSGLTIPPLLLVGTRLNLVDDNPTTDKLTWKNNLFE